MGTFRVLTAGVCLTLGLYAQSGAVASYLLARQNRDLGDYEGAERVLRAALADESVSQGNRVELSVSLADLLREEGRMSEAHILLTQARSDEQTPKEHLDVLLESAQMEVDQKRWEQGREIGNEISETGGPLSPSLEAAADRGLGECWMSEGNLARAEPLLRRSLELYRTTPGSAPLNVATALASMTRFYLKKGKLALADEAVTEAIATDTAALWAEHPQVAVLLALRATVLERRGDMLEALDCLDRARSIVASRLGAESVAVAAVSMVRHDLALKVQKRSGAKTSVGESVSFREK